MANMQHIRQNKLRLKSGRYRTLTALLGIPVLCAASHINPVLGVLTLFPLYHVWRRQGRWLAGAIGEETALGLPTHAPGCLAELPDSYIIFNQVEISHRNQKREMDLVVLGPNGLFVIEVKHYRGTIQGREKDRFWTQCFHGQRKTKPVRNPVSQIKSAIYIFKKKLESHNISPWIQGLVVFTHPNCTLKNDKGSVPVLRLSELTNYILTYKTKYRFSIYMPLFRFLVQHAGNPHAVKSQMLHKKAPKAPNEPQHVSHFIQNMTKNKIEEIMKHETTSLNDLVTQMQLEPNTYPQRDMPMVRKIATKQAIAKRQVIHHYNTNVTININNPTIIIHSDKKNSECETRVSVLTNPYEPD